MIIRDLTDILVASYPGHSPVIRFDGVGGISMSNVNKRHQDCTYLNMYICL